MAKRLMKGCEALAEAAILAGCRYYFGSPVAQQAELSAYLAKHLPLVDGTFVQAADEISAINMVYGAAAAGARVMTSGSSTGMSLKQEGISGIAASELPCVIVNTMCGGSVAGASCPAQADYWQATRGGTHGDYRNIVFAPCSVQEMVDMTIAGFNYADRFRTPVLILADSIVAQMMEPVELPKQPFDYDMDSKKWALGLPGTNKHNKNVCASTFTVQDELEEHNWHLYQKYQVIDNHFTQENKDLAIEEYMCDDAEIVLVGYGIIARLLKTVVEKCRKRGVKAGLARPKILWPFPTQAFKKLSQNTEKFMVIEMSCGQMVEDVKMAVNGAKPVYFFGRTGGAVPSDFEIFNEVSKLVCLD